MLYNMQINYSKEDITYHESKNVNYCVYDYLF